jgi:hypothetical protein
MFRHDNDAQHSAIWTAPPKYPFRGGVSYRLTRDPAAQGGVTAEPREKDLSFLSLQRDPAPAKAVGFGP